MKSDYSKLTPKEDLGKRQPKKPRIKKLISRMQKHNRPCRARIAPGYATKYQPEFLSALREICEIYDSSAFEHPELQVLILLLDNEISPCRADHFNREIVLRLGGRAFTRA
ncbi:hypothetical protein [Phaeobacter inhibens]|uniref:hypothetical protein n=1 Tax=Phaeobacter inhibens TaxID=221822 RepID=UPI0021A8C495|nr:hypothetical protein [Phaeobacter inhibens]UWR44704.1 hypothetical protein K4F86_15400 [Phaeobacter inhibens]